MAAAFATHCSIAQVFAQTAGDAATGDRQSFFSVSPRLVFYSLLQEGQSETDAAVLSLAQGLGFLHEPGKGPQLAWRVTGFQPVLSYDPNINGGLTGERFKIGSLTFRTDPESRAVSGPVLGAALSNSIGWSVGRGQTLSVAGNARVVYSPNHEISRTNANAQTCLRSYVESWQFLDLCGGASYEKKDLGQTNSTYASANFARAFTTRTGTNLANILITREFKKTYEKTSASVGVESYFTGNGVLTLRIAMGEEIAGENTMLHAVYVSYGQLVLGVGTNIGLSYEREGGDVFFGQERNDNVIKLALTGQISPTLSATLSVEHRTSDIEFFDGTSVSLDLNVLRMQF